MSKLNWVFPHGMNLTPTGSNHASIETFSDNVIESLTREVLQNAQDVCNKKTTEPIHVSFDKVKIKNTDIPNLETLTDDALPRATNYWKDNQDTLRYLDKFKETITLPTIDVLKISDYHTTGLLPKNFRSLVNSDAYSEKRDETAGGSKGLGKAAPFAASDLRMVFYSSLASDGISRSGGVLNFVSFQPGKNENEVTQSRGAYLKDNEAINEQFTFDYKESKKRRNYEYGTDLFILGFKKFDEWAKNIKFSVLENFLVAIYKGQLSVSVDGDIINKETVSEIILKFEEKKLNKSERNRLQSVMSYYDVLTSKETKYFEFDERFEKYDFIKKTSDGTLLLREHENPNMRVLQTRQTGMKIYERTHIGGTINFTGVFQALGNELNSYLRAIENPNHNDWSVDRINQDNKAEQKIASELLNDLFQWYKEKIKDSFEEEIKEKVGAFGVADLLPILSDDEGDRDYKDEEKDQGIQFKIKSVERNKKKPSTPSGRVEDEEAELDRLADELDSEGEEKGFDDGEGGQQGGTSGEPTGGESNGGQSTGGDLGREGDEIDRKVSYKEIKDSKALKVKVIEEDASIGLYRLIGKQLSNHKQLALGFNYIDARAMKERAKLIDVRSNESSISIGSNKLILKNLKKNQVVNVLFKVDKNIRLKMRIDTYEIRS